MTWSMRPIKKEADHRRDRNYPEVIGINGWCDNSAIMFLLEETVDPPQMKEPLFLVTQTTIQKDTDRSFSSLGRDRSVVEVKNTIWEAPQRDRKDAVRQQKSDVMLIVGDRAVQTRESCMKLQGNM